MFQKLSLNDSNFKFVIAIEKRRVLYIVRAWIVNWRVWYNLSSLSDVKVDSLLVKML